MSAKQGKPIKAGDRPILQVGNQKAPSQPAKSDQRNASKTPGGTRANRNVAR